MSLNIFNTLPFWSIYLLIMMIILLSVRGGIVFAKSKKKTVLNEDGSTINTMVGAILGLLAFILAFTFNLSSSRFDARKHLFLEEVNSIETSWLRAGLVEQPFSKELQNALVKYVEIRIQLVKNPQSVLEVIDKSQEIQKTIWSLIKEMNDKKIGDPLINSLLIDAINDMFDDQTKREAVGLIDHIPNLIWIALFSLIIISMFAVGYLHGKSEGVNWVMVLALALSFAVIIIIIVELDSPNGLIRINNQILFEMYDRINIK
ncbi:hypothetical protein K8352_03985 [Flavobacteriaceae bacterium F89]|uniref:DUF4239 domain-containing protein n=1 Tax=Cerina litoralis TaxID=2874477 RepID=A0AAE3ESZ0_9FLAO|nr:hypothetical protein [Cerina litoralis]MCG2459895.1 hypothetical protein [Cerina litoralis]